VLTDPAQLREFVDAMNAKYETDCAFDFFAPNSTACIGVPTFPAEP
jgi:hypothetical protein